MSGYDSYILMFIGIVLLVSILMGLRRGIVGIFLSVISCVVVLVIMTIGTPIIENELKGGPIEEKFRSAIEEHISTLLLTKQNEAQSTVELIESTQSIDLSDDVAAELFFENLGIKLPEAVTDEIAKAINSGDGIESELSVEEDSEVNNQLDQLNVAITEQTAAPITAFVLHGAALAIAFLIAMIITRVIMLFGRILDKMPFVGGASRILGGIWGFFVGMMIIWICMDILACFSIIPIGQELLETVQEHPLLNIIYLYNPLGFLIA